MGDPLKIECLADVIEHAMQATYKEKGFRMSIWWRGQCADRPEWVLAPKIYRKGYDYETELLITTRFKLYAPSRYENCPGETAYSAWLCLMQHHGLPSRLLDWTESALVATYFAVNQKDHLQEPGVLLALVPGDLNECQGGRLSPI